MKTLDLTANVTLVRSRSKNKNSYKSPNSQFLAFVYSSHNSDQIKIGDRFNAVNNDQDGQMIYPSKKESFKKEN